ncbi:DUF2752 domain-containing protein [Kitasatospora sp. NPDC057198]|uniref:DUF2752 domain-containing protein n=1 Tax=Kitasatospora sp. NPDC057198 TaxID=3346046 RepID=UPI0036319ACA
MSEPSRPGPPGAVAPTTRWRRSAGSLPGSVLRVVLRASLVAGAAAGVAAVYDVHDPGVLCPLRLLTGVPCPLCGSTTVFIEAGRGHWGAALLANPVAVLAAVALVCGPLGAGRLRSLSYRGRTLLAGAALVSAWAWEVVRLGPLRF